MRKIVLSLCLLATSPASWGQSGPRPEILVLGTYHMANRGHDLYNVQADDVLSPKRQQEITQLLEVLRRFHPTKIAIEADFGSQRVAQEYSDYLGESTHFHATRPTRSVIAWPRSLGIRRFTR